MARPVNVHIPGRPKTDSPPQELSDLTDSYQPQSPVVRWGLTATEDGRWALLVSVPEGTDVPLPAVESYFEGHPVIYQVEPSQPIRPQ